MLMKYQLMYVFTLVLGNPTQCYAISFRGCYSFKTSKKVDRNFLKMHPGVQELQIFAVIAGFKTTVRKIWPKPEHAPSRKYNE